MRRVTTAAAVILLAMIALTACAAPRTAAQDADARSRYLTAMCPVARAFQIREHEAHTSDQWIIQDDAAARDALLTSIATLSRGDWPTPIAGDIARIRDAELTQMSWFDAIVKAGWSTEMFDPPPASALDSQLRATGWLHIKLDNACAALPSPDGVDAALRRDYLSTSCRASLAFGQLLEDQIHGGPALIRHDAAVSHAAFLAELDTLDPGAWPRELAADVEQFRQNVLWWTAWTADVARDGVFPAYPPMDQSDTNAGIRIDAHLGVDPQLDCPTL